LQVADNGALWHHVRARLPQCAHKHESKNMAKSTQNEPTESIGEAWEVVTEATDESGLPAVDRFHIARVAKLLRGKFAQVQLIVVEQRRGSSWSGTGQGIAVPEGSSASVTPEGGARRIVALARAFWDLHDGRRALRVNALGESQSGGTTKSLFSLQLDFSDRSEDDDDDDDGERGRKGHGKKSDPFRAARGLEEVAVLESLRHALSDTVGHHDRAMVRCGMMADKVVEMAAHASTNQEAILQMVKLNFKEKERERQAESDARSDARTDKLYESFLGVGSTLFDDYLRKRMGLNKDHASGPYWMRLDELLKLIPEDKVDACRDILSPHAWDILQDMRAEMTDAAFTQLVVRLANAMPTGKEGHEALFMKVAVTLGNQELVMALGKLLTEASP
jgi:hypothetical protein